MILRVSAMAILFSACVRPDGKVIGEVYDVHTHKCTVEHVHSTDGTINHCHARKCVVEKVKIGNYPAQDRVVGFYFNRIISCN